APSKLVLPLAVQDAISPEREQTPRSPKGRIKRVEVVPASAQLLRLLKADPRELYNISPEQFELLLLERLTKAGYDVTRIGAVNRKDGGVDLVARPLRSQYPFLMAVQAKHHRRPELKVGPDDLKNLHAVVATQPFNAGLLVTNTTFTADAEWWAAE